MGSMARIVLLPVLLTMSVAAAEIEALGIGLETFPYPYPVQFLPLRIEGQEVRMAYMDVPAKGTARKDAPAVVLMHGKNFGGYYWKNVVESLTTAGYRVIVPDQIGWGKSTKPDIHYSFQLLAANTNRLLDRLHVQNVAVIGHSTGGMLAVRYALLHPERVTHLILENPLGMEDYRVLPPHTPDELYQDELQNTDPAKIESVFVRYFAHPQPEVYKPLAQVPIRVTMSAEFPRWARASALAYEMIYEQPVRYEYRLLKMPVMLIVGDKDHTVPLSADAPPEIKAKMGNFVQLARDASHDIPRASVVVVEDCGHIPHIEKAQVFRESVMRFLQTN